MPKQIGFLKIDGTLGDVSFYKRGGAYMMGSKPVITKERVATDPAYQRTRENMLEFSNAAKAAKLLRTAFRLQMLDAKDGQAANRLLSLLLRIVKSDPVNARGKRNAGGGNLALLDGFSFNSNAGLDTTLKTTYSAFIERASGKSMIKITPFVPATQVAAPAGATHFRVVSACAGLNFSEGAMETASDTSAVLPLNNAEVSIPELVSSFTLNSASPLFLVMGIVFLQVVNGTEYPLNDKSFNALQVVMVDAP